MGASLLVPLSHPALTPESPPVSSAALSLLALRHLFQAKAMSAQRPVGAQTERPQAVAQMTGVNRFQSWNRDRAGPGPLEAPRKPFLHVQLQVASRTPWLVASPS